MNGGRMGALPVDGSEPDHMDDAVHALCLSKGSRYLCTGGKGKVLRVWDTRKKLCIKTLKGHSDLITGAMYNQKEDQLASISVSGDLLLHNLQTGTRATEIKDPQRQALRALEYSPHRRSFLVTAGDEGTVNIWDTNSRGLKATWPKKHSAPATGVCFSPTDAKFVVSAGLDKRLIFYDITNKTPVSTVVAEAPLSSLAIKDDGRVLAVGTNNGRILFYDIRRSTWLSNSAIKAYPSQALVALSWQHSTPSPVGKGSMDAMTTVSEEVALLGAKPEDVPLIPDPMPSGMEGRARSHTVPTGGGPARSASAPSRRVDREQNSSMKGSGPSDGILGLTTAASGAMSASFGGGTGPPVILSTVSSTLPNHLRVNGAISSLQTARMSSLNGEMDVFSPLVDVQPLMQPLAKCYEGIGMGSIPSPIPEKAVDGVPNFDSDDGSLGSAREEGSKLPNIEELRIDTRRRLERVQSNRQAGASGGSRKSWGSRSGEPRALTPSQEDPSGSRTPAGSSAIESTPTTSGYDAMMDRVIERSPSVTPPAMWGGDAPLVTPVVGNGRSSGAGSDTGASYLTSRFLPPYHSYLPAASLVSRLDASTFPSTASSGTSSTAGMAGTTSLSSWISGTEAFAGSSLPLMAGAVPPAAPSRWHKSSAVPGPNGANLDIGGRGGASSGAMSVIREGVSMPSDGGGAEQSSEGEKSRDGGRSRRSDPSNNVASPNTDARQNNDVGSALPDSHPMWGRGGYLPSPQQNLTAGPGSEVADVPQPSNFALQLVQNVVSETLGNLGRAMHEQTQNLHLDVLRQFHMQQMETRSMYEELMTNQSVLFDEIRALQREVQKLRHMY
ncbi:hypothetical protein CBR_g37200 [Chara braunii]|uniref:Uncharacterized protein n=1 Tax=Chara braunii TaxID=69332 RepID=A0A388LME4_CHABU|nr:hypothetical protein CBR_g37200 [Chara braunii]|eukprot:GBG83488.1 hypothetical protein CBR_g37200 [Chara braunii]